MTPSPHLSSWCAPEVLEGRSNGSTAADVYSLGATVWHLLVGRSPFRVPDGDNSQAAMIERVLRAPAPVTGLDVPAALDRLLTRCLAKDPAHRPASALEFARDLQLIEVQQGLPRTETGKIQRYRLRDAAGGLRGSAEKT